MMQYIIVFAALAIYVTLNTIRLILIIRGKKGISAAIAAVENFIYMLTFAYAITSKDSNIFLIIIASAGYASGVLLGSFVERKLNMGYLVIQIIAEGDMQNLLTNLRKENYGITSWKANGLTGNKEVLHILIKKRRYQDLESKIKTMLPKAFVVMYEPKYFSGGFYK